MTKEKSSIFVFDKSELMVMKRIMVFLFTALCSVALYAQDNKEAIIYLNGGSFWGSHNRTPITQAAIVMPFNL